MSVTISPEHRESKRRRDILGSWKTQSQENRHEDISKAIVLSNVDEKSDGSTLGS
jgi:hypothetical protein